MCISPWQTKWLKLLKALVGISRSSKTISWPMMIWQILKSSLCSHSAAMAPSWRQLAWLRIDRCQFWESIRIPNAPSAVFATEKFIMIAQTQTSKKWCATSKEKTSSTLWDKDCFSKWTILLRALATSNIVWMRSLSLRRMSVRHQFSVCKSMTISLANSSQVVWLLQREQDQQDGFTQPRDSQNLMWNALWQILEHTMSQRP